jgi:hypothetical protein
MGALLSTSANGEETKSSEKTENIKRLFQNLDDDQELLETLNLSEFKTKLPLPIIGGSKDRYLKYDIFNKINELKGGNNEEDDHEEEESSYKSISNNDAMSQIKNIINAELESLKQEGGCDCNEAALKLKKQKAGALKLNKVDSSTTTRSSGTSSSSDINEKGKKRGSSKKASSKKYKSKKNKRSLNSRLSNLLIETSQSGGTEVKENNNIEIEDDEDDDIEESEEQELEEEEAEEEEEKMEEEDSVATSNDEEGLSIFPFNSSDVNSSISDNLNLKMLRRKI